MTLCVLLLSIGVAASAHDGASEGTWRRAVVSSDTRGTHPDDLESTDDWLADTGRFDFEGSLSSPSGQGRSETVAKVIDANEKETAVTKELPHVRWGKGYLRRDPEWYASAEARAVADNVIRRQSPQGGWPKSIDLAQPPRMAGDVPPPDVGRANSIDNDATTLPMEFLARVADATGDAKYSDAFTRGLDYLLMAQYPNGGWPQFYPLRKGYYSHITYNDGAMMRVMTLLREVVRSEPPYAFVDADRREKAAAAVAKGIDCILKTQVRQDGKLTAWCAQHDEVTLEPAWARNYEVPSLSGSESVGVVRFLMEEESPSPEVVDAIEGAVAWFKAVQIDGFRYRRGRDASGMRDAWVEADPAGGPLWARFYEIGTNRPVFVGRDKAIHYALDEIEQERRGGYSYYGDWAANLLAKNYPRWLAKQGRRQTSPDVAIATQQAVELGPSTVPIEPNRLAPTFVVGRQQITRAAWREASPPRRSGRHPVSRIAWR